MHVYINIYVLYHAKSTLNAMIKRPGLVLLMIEGEHRHRFHIGHVFEGAHDEVFDTSVLFFSWETAGREEYKLMGHKRGGRWLLRGRRK